MTWGKPHYLIISVRLIFQTTLPEFITMKKRSLVLFVFLATAACEQNKQSNNISENEIIIAGTANPGNTTAPLVERLSDRRTILSAGSPSLKIANLAVNVAAATSTVGASLREQEYIRKSLAWQRRPSLVPSASVNPEGDSVVRLSVQQTLWDGGHYRGLRDQADASINIARIESWQEYNRIVFIALEQYFSILRNKSLVKSSAAILVKLQNLRADILVRLAGGVSERSDLLQIDLRIQEIKTLNASDRSSLYAAESLLESLIGVNVGAFSKTDMTSALEVLGAIQTDIIPPSVLLAQISYEKSRGESVEVKSTRFPRIIVEGYTQYSNGSTNNGVGLALNTNTFAGFAYRSNMAAALEREKAKRLEVMQAKIEHDRMVNRLEIIFADLSTRENLLRAQLKQTNDAVDIFPAQFEAGQRPLIDALTVYNSALDVERQLIDIQAEQLLNRIQLGESLGVLAASGEGEHNE